MSTLANVEVKDLTSKPGEVERFTSNKVDQLEIASISPSPTNPRRSLGDLAELVQSIAELGVLQPVTVRYLSDRTPELIFGHRRLEAAKQAGLETIPAIVWEMSDPEVFDRLASVRENILSNQAIQTSQGPLINGDRNFCSGHDVNLWYDDTSYRLVGQSD